jgi:hypothetical protein
VGVFVIVGVGGEVVVYTIFPHSQSSESTIFTRNETSEYGEGTSNVYGKVIADPTKTQFALKISQ